MISYTAYKLIHVLFLFFLFLSLGAYLFVNRLGSPQGRRLAAATHGVAVIAIVVSGFGLLARSGYLAPSSWPPWLWVKILIWAVLAIIPAVIKRAPSLLYVLWVAIPLLGGIAAYVALYRLNL